MRLSIVKRFLTKLVAVAIDDSQIGFYSVSNRSLTVASVPTLQRDSVMQ